MAAWGRGIRGRGTRVAIGSFVLLCFAAPVAAQPSLHAAMLYGGADTARPFAERPAANVAAYGATADTLRDDWLGRDKALHAGFSFLFALSSQYVLTSKLDMDEDGALPVSAGVALSLGLAKEIADSRRRVNPLFSVRDLAADAAGVALAVGLILL
jgi:uncharacterized protein YfiM (DUF2279 family)